MVDNELKQDVQIFAVNHTNNILQLPPNYQELVVNNASNNQSTNRAGILTDDSGDNISFKNFSYSELTGLYWIWKNTSADITGLVHYRRFLKSPNSQNPLNAEEIISFCNEKPVISPYPINLPGTVADHYCCCHISDDLRALCKIMQKQPTHYKKAFFEHLESNDLIPYNICVARKEYLNDYCCWLFKILEEMECSIDLFNGRNPYQMRVFGFISERLFSVWLKANHIVPLYCEILNPLDDNTHIMKTAYDHKWPRYSKLMHPVNPNLLFDERLYLNKYDDIHKAFGDDQIKARNHFFTNGINEGRYTYDIFTLDDYKNIRPNLREAACSDMAFYVNFEKEISEKQTYVTKNKITGMTKLKFIDFASVYDWYFYTNKYDDVPNDPNKTSEALKHFIEVGMLEGRQASKGFNLSKFKQLHPWLTLLFKNRNKLFYYCSIFRNLIGKKKINWKFV